MPLKQEVAELIASMGEDVDAVVVEGGNDRDALRRAGFDGVIETCSETEGFVAFAKRVARSYDRVAILTDYDAEGKELNRKLQEYLPESQNRKRWRRELGKILTDHGRRDIESITNIMR